MENVNCFMTERGLFRLLIHIRNKTLDRLLHWRLIALGPVHDLAGGGVGDGLGGSFAVQVHQLVQVEAGLLQDLDLADVDLVQGVDALASLLDVDSDGVRDQLLNNVLQVAGRDLAGDDVDHFLADLTNLKGKK